MAAEIRLGTMALSANGWSCVFYPKGMKTQDHLNFYSTRFDSVEVDSTFYRCPTIEAVNNWHFKTPPGFIFSLKIPRTITHDKILLDCDQEFETFMDTVDVLDDKLGPLLFQFPFFGKDVFDSDAQFVLRLKAFFMLKLPKVGPYRFAVEIRNKFWLKPGFSIYSAKTMWPSYCKTILICPDLRYSRNSIPSLRISLTCAYWEIAKELKS